LQLAFDDVSDLAKSKIKHGVELGNGTFGVVHKAFHQPSGTEVAVKTFRTKDAWTGERFDSRKVLSEAFAEALALDRRGGHPHIVQLLDCFSYKGVPALVLELWGTDLGKMRAHSGGFSAAQLRCIAFAGVSALHFIHGFGLLHADVKPENILAKAEPSGELAVKLADLGAICEAFGRERTHRNDHLGKPFRKNRAERASGNS